MLLDCRSVCGTFQHIDQLEQVDAFFFSNNNCGQIFTLGDRMIQLLPTNKNLENVVRGPVLFVNANWKERFGREFEKFENMSTAALTGAGLKELKVAMVESMKAGKVTR